MIRVSIHRDMKNSINNAYQKKTWLKFDNLSEGVLSQFWALSVEFFPSPGHKSELMDPAPDKIPPRLWDHHQFIQVQVRLAGSGVGGSMFSDVLECVHTPPGVENKVVLVTGQAHSLYFWCQSWDI